MDVQPSRYLAETTFSPYSSVSKVEIQSTYNHFSDGNENYICSSKGPELKKLRMDELDLEQYPVVSEAGGNAKYVTFPCL